MSSMNKFMLYILFSIFIFSCEKAKKEDVISDGNKNQNITLVFQQRKNIEDDRLKRYNKVDFSELDFFEQQEIVKNNWNTSDTIIITPKSKSINLVYNFNNGNDVDSFFYIFNQGDTVYFEYNKEGLPYAYIPNRKTKQYDLNFQVDVNLKRPLENFHFYLKNGKMRSKIESIEYKEEEQEYFSNVKHFLDSIKKKGLVSEDIYQLHSNRYNYLNINLNLKEYDFNNITSKDLSKDDLLYLGTYRYFLDNYVLHRYKIKLQDSKDPFSYDYKQAFDSIAKSKEFSTKVKNYLLYTYLQNIASEGTLSELVTYSNLFKSTVNDSILLNSINDKYLLNFTDLKKETQEIYFINSQKQKQTLSQILEDNKGKVIYMDFWASWCSPCRALMPASRELHKQYKDKDVVFLYLSIDNDFEKWQKANRDEGLSQNRFSLLAVNYPNANFYKKLNLRSIPRYLLYDKQGNLVHKNAPNPDSDVIKQELDKLLQ